MNRWTLYDEHGSKIFINEIEDPLKIIFLKDVDVRLFYSCFFVYKSAFRTKNIIN